MKWLVAMIVAGLLPVCALGQGTDEHARETLAFADHLYATGDFYRAITEYERFLFLAPGSDSANRAKYQIGLCYYRGKKWEAAIPIFRELKDNARDEAAGREACLRLAESYHRSGDYARAEVTLDEYERAYPQDSRADEVRIQKAALLLRQNQEDWCRTELNGIATNAPARKRADQMLTAVDAWRDLPEKSPWLAGALSAALPGAGQFYDQRPADAVIAFLLNGVCIAGAAAAFHNDEPVAGSALTLVATPWYFGNIYNAASSAHKFNKQQHDDFFGRPLFQFGFLVEPGEGTTPTPGVGLNMRY